MFAASTLVPAAIPVASETGNGIYVRLGPQLALAEATLGVRLTLETAPMLEG